MQGKKSRPKPTWKKTCIHIDFQSRLVHGIVVILLGPTKKGESLAKTVLLMPIIKKVLAAKGTWLGETFPIEKICEPQRFP